MNAAPRCGTFASDHTVPHDTQGIYCDVPVTTFRHLNGAISSSDIAAAMPTAAFDFRGKVESIAKALINSSVFIAISKGI